MIAELPMEAGNPQEGEQDGKASPSPKIKEMKEDIMAAWLFTIHQPHSLINIANVLDSSH